MNYKEPTELLKVHIKIRGYKNHFYYEDFAIMPNAFCSEMLNGNIEWREKVIEKSSPKKKREMNF
jgi:hypothetical protein